MEKECLLRFFAFDWCTLPCPTPTSGLGTRVDPVPGCFLSYFVRPFPFIFICPRTKEKPFGYPEKNEKNRKGRIEALMMQSNIFPCSF